MPSDKQRRQSVMQRLADLSDLAARVSLARKAAAPLLGNYRRSRVGSLFQWTLCGILGLAFLLYGYEFAANAPRLIMPFVVPPVVLALLTIWALPAGNYAPTKLLGGFYWAFMVALIVWPNYLAIALPGLPWLTMVRITGAPLAILFLICISVSAKFRRDLKSCIDDGEFTWKSVALYIAIVTVTLPLSHKFSDSLNKYIILILNQLVIFFVSAYIFRITNRVERWVYLLLATDILICLVGLWEAKLGYAPWAGHIPSFLKIDDPIVLRILAGGSRAATGIHRVASVQTTPLGLAELVGLSTPFALHLAVSKNPLIVRIVAALSIPLFVETIILTDARLGFVAILVATSLYLLVSSMVRWREMRTSIFGPAVVLSYPAIFISIMSATFLVGAIRRKVWGDGSQTASNEARKGQWANGMPKVYTHPLGHGFGEASSVLGYANQGGIVSIDSYYLNLLLDTGFIGFGVYMALFIGSSWIAAKTVISAPNIPEYRLLMPLSVSLIGFLVVKGVLSQDANHPVLFMMLGAIVALIHRIKSAERLDGAQVGSKP